LSGSGEPIDLNVTENSINAYKESKMSFNVKTPGKFYFKINDKIVKVYGDSKWEMIKRWFGRMHDD